MSWLAAILLAVVGLVVAILLFGLERKLWASLAATLVFGLAGYALQASPNLPSAPKPAGADNANADFDIVAARKELIGSDERSYANLMITADAMARNRRYIEAAQLYGGIARENPRDFEAWLALGIALAEHADGTLTAPALYAFRQARAVRPEHPASAYFLGFALVRQGRLAEARQLWSDALANAPEDAQGRAGLEERLRRLDEVLGALGQMPPQAPAQ